MKVLVLVDGEHYPATSRWALAAARSMGHDVVACLFVGGSEKIALTLQQIPVHSHALTASATKALQDAAAANTLAQPKGSNLYGVGPPDSPMATQGISPVGGGQPHSNMQPYLCIAFIISLFGIFPSPT